MPQQAGKTSNIPLARRRERRFARYRSEFPVRVTFFSGEEHEQLEAHGSVLSEAGIGIVIAAELTLGEVASLAFSLPGVPQPWEVRAVLRYRRGYHYGFEFLSLSPEQAAALASFLSSLRDFEFCYLAVARLPGNPPAAADVT